MGPQLLNKSNLIVHRVTRTRPVRTNFPAPSRRVAYDEVPKEDAPTVAVDSATLGPEEEPPGVSCDTVVAALEPIEIAPPLSETDVQERLVGPELCEEYVEVPVRECDEIAIEYSLPVIARSVLSAPARCVSSVLTAMNSIQRSIKDTR